MTKQELSTRFSSYIKRDLDAVKTVMAGQL